MILQSKSAAKKELKCFTFSLFSEGGKKLLACKSAFPEEDGGEEGEEANSHS